MRAALCGRDVVDKAEHALGIVLCMDDREHHLEVVRLALNIDGIGIDERLAALGDVAEHEIAKSSLKMIGHRKRSSAVVGRAKVCDRDRQIAVEIGKFAASARDNVERELFVVEHSRVGQKRDQRAAFLFGTRLGGHLALFDAAPDLAADLGRVKFLRVLHTLFIDLDGQPFGQRVCYARAHAVQTARRLVFPVVELAAGVQLGEHHLHARHSVLGVYIDGDSSAVVSDARAVVGVESDVDVGAVPVGDLIDAVVDDLPKDVVHSPAARAADIHTGALAHRLEPFEDFE